MPNKKGELKPRDNDSENKIFNTAHEFLGDNKNFRGRFTLFSERPLCSSCASVANQFQNYYNNAKLTVVHNNGDISKPSYLNRNKFTFNQSNLPKDQKKHSGHKQNKTKQDRNKESKANRQKNDQKKTSRDKTDRDSKENRRK